MPRKPILSICRTCKEPLPGYKFRRHSDELRSRHDSCITCEDAIKRAKAQRMSDAQANKRAYNKARYAAPIKSTEIKTRWIGGKYPGVTT